MKYNAHALGNYYGHTYLNCKEALENSYNMGFRFFEVDIQRTSDGHFVAYHLWTKADADHLQIPFNPKNPIPDLNTFLNYRYLTNVFPNGLTPLTLEGIFKFMRKHRDITVMFDFLAGHIDRNNAGLMKSFAEMFTDKKIIKRSVIETYSLNNARFLYEAGYPNIQPWIDMPERSEKDFQSIDEILDFIKKYSVKNVSMNAARIYKSPTDIKALHQNGVRVFSPGWSRLEDAERLGVDVLTTDLPATELPISKGIKWHFRKMRYRLFSHLFFGKRAKKYRQKYKAMKATTKVKRKGLSYRLWKQLNKKTYVSKFVYKLHKHLSKKLVKKGIIPSYTPLRLKELRCFDEIMKNQERLFAEIKQKQDAALSAFRQEQQKGFEEFRQKQEKQDASLSAFRQEQQKGLEELRQKQEKQLAGIDGMSYEITRIQNSQTSVLERSKREKSISLSAIKRQIRVAFATSDANTWQVGYLYNFLKDNPSFEPYVIVMPFDHVDFKQWEYVERYKQEHQKFLDMKYDVREFYDPENDTFSLKDGDVPDIVFFTTTLATRSVDVLSDMLSSSYQIFLSYGYFLTDPFPPIPNIYNFMFNSRYHRRFDAIFWETRPTAELSKEISGNIGVNSMFLGYPKIEKLIDGHTPSDPWKKTQGNLKRIIWAPHHSINQKRARTYGFSNFLEMADYMLEFAKKNKDKIQIAFKPHKNLKTALDISPDWGAERTAAYYAEWDKLENGQYVEGGNYEDLFLTSDAMILDSISFICEYAFTGKPALFVIADETVPKKLNKFGKMAFDTLTYKASVDTCMKENGEIDKFLNEQVLGGQDPIAQQRREFVDKYMLYKNGRTPSENIYGFLCELTGK